MGDPGPQRRGQAQPGGVTHRLEVPRALAGERVDRAVAVLLGLNRRQAATLVAEGSVSLRGRPVVVRSGRLVEGQVLEVEVGPPTAADRLEPDFSVHVPVVEADEHVIVVDKPAGLVVHPGAGHVHGTLVQGIVAAFPDVAEVGDPMRPGIVHRLDVGTSGLMLVARTPMAYEALVSQLGHHTVERRYLALACGRLEASAGLIDAPVGRAERDRTQMAVAVSGREARTRYWVVERFTEPATATLVECSLETGRTHQVRVHLAAIGNPVVGDVRYGGRCPPLSPGRPFLHAHQLSFDHPASGERRTFTSPLSRDLQELRDLLR